MKNLRKVNICADCANNRWLECWYNNSYRGQILRDQVCDNFERVLKLPLPPKTKRTSSTYRYSYTMSTMSTESSTWRDRYYSGLDYLCVSLCKLIKRIYKRLKG